MNDNNIQDYKWKDQTIYTFGDSITWYDGNDYFKSHNEYGKKATGYQSYMRERLKARVKNFGESGATLVDIASIIKSQNFSSVDAATITGGVNDWNKYIPLGNLEDKYSDFDIKTSYGALQSSIEFIIKENPKVKIFLMTPIPGKIKEFSDSVLAGQEFPVKYRDMFIEIGRLYEIPVLDWYNLS